MDFLKKNLIAVSELIEDCEHVEFSYQCSNLGESFHIVCEVPKNFGLTYCMDNEFKHFFLNLCILRVF